MVDLAQCIFQLLWFPTDLTFQIRLQVAMAAGATSCLCTLLALLAFTGANPDSLDNAPHFDEDQVGRAVFGEGLGDATPADALLEAANNAAKVHSTAYTPSL